MEVQATGEAFSPQKRTPSNSNFLPFSYFCGVFALFDPDQDPPEQSQCGSIRGPDPQHWLFLLENLFHYAIFPV